MRTEADNPAFQQFKDLLPASGRYPARWVDIFSNSDDDLRYYDVEVVFIPRGEGAPELDYEFWDAFAAYNERWMGDLGNSVMGWMEPGGFNPAKVFGLMLVYGFTDQQELDLAVREFAHIEECDWARALAGGLMADALRGGARDRPAIIAALEQQAPADWAADILSVLRDEAEF